jgi:UDP-N-acetyl-D-mannosaminuronic acid dehydrogenase
MKNKKLMVIGLGEVGSTVLLEMNDIIQSRNLPYELMGVELDPVKIEKYSKMGFKVYNTNEDWPKCDGYLICVFTTQQILTTIDKIKRNHDYNSHDYFISIESTIDPNDLQVVLGILDVPERSNLVVCPHRLVFNDPRKGAFNLDRLIGIDIEYPCKLGYEFYREFSSAKLYVTSYGIAAISKMVENAYRFCDIVFAQELKRSCDKQGIDYNELRSAVNTKWNIELKEAKDGCGGHCLPKETKFAMNFFPDNPIFRTFYALNELYKQENKI